MATEILTEDDTDEIDIVEVDAAPGEEAAAAAALADKDEPDEKDSEADDADEDDAEDDGEEDSRLAENDDETDEERRERNRRKSKGQRQRLKAKNDAKDREIELLRTELAEVRRNQNQLQGAQTQSAAAQIENQIAETLRDISAADSLMADAIKNGDGETFAAAQKLRDAAKDRERELSAAKATYTNQGAPDPRVTDYAGKWMAANPWYRKDGADVNSAVVNSIDAGLMQEGYNPASELYWKELTRRVSQRLRTEEQPQRKERRKEVPETTKPKKAPPLGNRGEGGQGARKQVFLSKERVDAIKAAGVWDDPQERAALIKAYEEYDREHSAAAR